MAHHVTVLYPNQDDQFFKVDYYVKEHLPKAIAVFNRYGLKSCNVIQYHAGDDGQQPPYVLGLHLVWETPKSMVDAFAAEDAKELFADVPNFTDATPVVLNGVQVG